MPLFIGGADCTLLCYGLCAISLYRAAVWLCACCDDFFFFCMNISLSPSHTLSLSLSSGLTISNPTPRHRHTNSDARPQYHYQVGVTGAKIERARNFCTQMGAYGPDDQPLSPCPPEFDAKWRFFWRIGPVRKYSNHCTTLHCMPGGDMTCTGSPL